MAAERQPDRVPDTIEELLASWAHTQPPPDSMGAKAPLPIVRIARPVPGRRYVVDANKSAVGRDGSQAGSSLADPKHAPILCADLSWTVLLSGHGDAEITVEFMPVFDAPSGRISGGNFAVQDRPPPIIHVGTVQTPFDRPDSPVGEGSALTFVLREPPKGIIVDELIIFLGAYTY